jgi:hypothetical protein
MANAPTFKSSQKTVSPLGVLHIELDRHIQLAYRPYDVQLFVPAELATHLEVGHPVMLTLEQSDS